MLTPLSDRLLGHLALAVACARSVLNTQTASRHALSARRPPEATSYNNYRDSLQKLSLSFFSVSLASSFLFFLISSFKRRRNGTSRITISKRHLPIITLIRSALPSRFSRQPFANLVTRNASLKSREPLRPRIVEVRAPRFRVNNTRQHASS